MNDVPKNPRKLTCSVQEKPMKSHSQNLSNHTLTTQFLSAPDVATLIATLGVPQALQGIAAYISQDFLRWKSFDKSARMGSHSKDGVIELMPIADDKTFTFKYVNGHPKNAQRGLSTVMAFGVLADVETGMPLLISELTLTTALRTAATSAIAARALARPESRTMALIGNGAQSEFQALAFHHLLGIEEIRVFDIDVHATQRLVRNLKACAPDLKVIVYKSTREAVRGADTITTATADKTNAHILTADMMEPGMHINGVGGDCPGKTEIAPQVLAMSNVFVEYEPQTRIEGDLQQMGADFKVTELWNVLAGNAPGRDHAQEITLFDSVGFALEDFSALRFLRDRARERGLGVQIDLIPQLEDPKDLFSLVATREIEHIA
jgi:ornithine cyclodeaminase